MLITADWDKLWSLSWRGLILLGTAGITHFILGRLLSYSCFRLIGANRGGAILRTQIFYPVILGIVLLKEPLTSFLVFGVLCIAIGVTLVSLEKGGEVPGIQVKKGILAGLGGALFWGSSGVLIKPVIEEIGSPYAAAFISYVVASLVIAGFLFSQGRREQLSQLDRQSLIPFIIGGVLTAAAQLFRYIALSYSPVSLVDPLISTSSLFIFIFSFLINRNIEVFTWKVFAGVAVTIAGTFLFFQ